MRRTIAASITITGRGVIWRAASLRVLSQKVSLLLKPLYHDCWDVKSTKQTFANRKSPLLSRSVCPSSGEVKLEERNRSSAAATGFDRRFANKEAVFFHHVTDRHRDFQFPSHDKQHYHFNAHTAPSSNDMSAHKPLPMDASRRRSSITAHRTSLGPSSLPRPQSRGPTSRVSCVSSPHTDVTLSAD